MTAAGVVIIGAGQAAAQCVGSLRAQGYAAPITVIGDEPELPYHRPPLSKKYLLGELPAERLPIRKPAYYERLGVQLQLGRRAIAIDRTARRVQLEGGDSVAYEYLILAMGGRARTLPAVPEHMAGVYSLRSRADADGLRRAVRPGQHLILVGAGYVGLEVAATLRGLGCAVTVLEAAPRILARVAAEPISAQLLACHQAQGSAIECEQSVHAVHGGARFEAVETTSRAVIPADGLIVGIGMVANDALAQAAGLHCDNGVRVDAQGRTDDPAIFAMGDVACRPVNGVHQRIESVDNAMATAQIVAAQITGADAPAATPPWFWSDQFDHKLQMVGLAPGSAAWVTRRDAEGHRLSCFYVEGGQLRAAQCLNAAGDFQVAKRLIASARPVSPAQLADPNSALRDL